MSTPTSSAVPTSPGTTAASRVGARRFTRLTGEPLDAAGSSSLVMPNTPRASVTSNGPTDRDGHRYTRYAIPLAAGARTLADERRK